MGTPAHFRQVDAVLSMLQRPLSRRAAIGAIVSLTAGAGFATAATAGALANTAVPAPVAASSRVPEWSVVVARGTTSITVTRAVLKRFERQPRPAGSPVGSNQTALRDGGVRLRDLVDAVGGEQTESVRVDGVGTDGRSRSVVMGPAQVRDSTTLISIGDRNSVERASVGELVVPAGSGRSLVGAAITRLVVLS